MVALARQFPPIGFQAPGNIPKSSSERILSPASAASMCQVARFGTLRGACQGRSDTARAGRARRAPRSRRSRTNRDPAEKSCRGRGHRLEEIESGAVALRQPLGPSPHEGTEIGLEAERMKQEKAKELIDGALDRLGDALDRGISDTMRTYLAAMARFRQYSWGNVLLISSRRTASISQRWCGWARGGSGGVCSPRTERGRRSGDAGNTIGVGVAPAAAVKESRRRQWARRRGMGGAVHGRRWRRAGGHQQAGSARKNRSWCGRPRDESGGGSREKNQAARAAIEQRGLGVAPESAGQTEGARAASSTSVRSVRPVSGWLRGR